MTPKAILFDCDGVLVDSEPITDRALVANLARHGLRVTGEEVADLFRGGTIHGVGEEAKRRGASIPQGWAEAMYAETYALLRDGCPLVPGVPGLLARLDAAGIPFGVGSNGSREKMRITLGQNELWERFEPFMVSAHDGIPAKPAPDIYLRLADLLGVAPSDALVVDDSPAGCRGGLAAGIPTIGFAARTDPARLAALGIGVVGSMEDLARRLGLAP